MSLVDVPNSQKIKCDWFYTARGRNRYFLGIKRGKKETDNVRYPLDAFEGCVDMEIFEGDDGRQEFELVNNGQLLSSIQIQKN